VSDLGDHHRHILCIRRPSGLDQANEPRQYATIVTPSANTEQLLALIALIVFGVAALAALATRTYYAVLTAGGLAVLAAAILWS
jgi:hypothetical protein